MRSVEGIFSVAFVPYRWLSKFDITRNLVEATCAVVYIDHARAIDAPYIGLRNVSVTQKHGFSALKIVR